MTQTRRIIWIVALAVLALIAAAVIAVNATDTASASTSDGNYTVCLGSNDGQTTTCKACVNFVCKTGTFSTPPTTRAVVQDPTLYGADAVDGDSASISASCGKLAKARWHITVTGAVGRLYTTHFNLGWCRNNGHITWVGPLKIWGDRGSLGDATGIKWDRGGTLNRNWFVWGANNHADGGFAATGYGQWKLCFSDPWPLQGEVCPIHKVNYGKVLVYSDGHTTFYMP